MIREYSVTDTIKIGDRIKFRSPTFSGPTGAVWRKVNGFSNDGKPTVRFNTWPDFVVRKHEIIQIDSLADKGAIRPIVKDALECDALVHQFFEIDVYDKYLAEPTEQCVNETYDDAYLIKEAQYLFDIACLQRDELYGEEDFDTIDIEVKQLLKFLDKHEHKGGAQ